MESADPAPRPLAQSRRHHGVAPREEAGDRRRHRLQHSHAADFRGHHTAKWVEAWDKFEALGAEIVIPGHGGPTDMATVRKWTRDYLVHLRGNVAEVVKAGGSLGDAYQVDQAAYLHLHTADELARSNAGRVFQAMEFE